MALALIGSPALAQLSLGDSGSAGLVAAAMARLSRDVTYDGSYRSIAYPNGDVPDNVGVCTDLVIRAFRRTGVDLQQLVHEDMRENFDEYPSNWGLTAPDTNIDHRRVPNLQVFFERNGQSLPISQLSASYLPGDLVTWRLDSNLPHIGIVAARQSADGARPLIIHNIGAGPALDDILFSFEITGHYRFTGAEHAN